MSEQEIKGFLIPRMWSTSGRAASKRACPTGPVNSSPYGEWQAQRGSEWRPKSISKENISAGDTSFLKGVPSLFH